MPSLRQTLLFIGCLILCQSAGISGAVITADTSWYTKPSFQPPDWLFGPVWLSLYVMMAVALYRQVIAPPGPARRTAWAWFGVQWLLNVAWTPAFFGLRSPGLALVIIVMLWCAIVGWMRASHRVDRRAVWLLLPYLAWVSFATVLNFAIWFNAR
jgi:tryptophan-rich sensory protein